MKERERGRRKKRKGKIEDKADTTTTRRSLRLKSFGSRSAVDTRGTRRTRGKLRLGLLETPPDKIKASRAAEGGSRAKYEVERVYLCDSVVITRVRLGPWFPQSKRTLFRYFRFGNRIRVKSSSERKNPAGIFPTFVRSSYR